MKTARRWMWVCCAVFMAALAGGCGGDGASESCGKVQPCGGDIKGQWTVGAACVSEVAVMTQLSTLAGLCPAATITDATVTSTGSFSFTAGMTYTMSLSSHGTAKANVPASCLSGLSCANLNGLLQVQLLLNPQPGLQSVTCAGTAGCVCTAVTTSDSLTESGTYSTAGSRLSTVSSAGASSTRNYCVQGSTLHFVTVDPAMPTGPMGQPAITLDTVATKK
ncbi:MAG: hypothetical protein ABUS79_15170 [Pseudomonadota bacterium]